MKRSLLVLFLLALSTLGCKRRYPQDDLKDMAANHSQIIYIKDTRTNLCFAYGWSGNRLGGPLFTHVPCEAIPLALLVTEETK